MVAGYGQLNYVASCWSSTTEGASDVSPFHLFHFAYCTCRSFVVLGCFCACCFLLCLVLCFACAAGIFLIIVADVSRWPTMLNRSFGCAKKKSYWNGKASFAKACKLGANKIPHLKWEQIIPPPFLKAWFKFFQVCESRCVQGKDMDEILSPTTLRGGILRQSWPSRLLALQKIQPFISFTCLEARATLWAFAAAFLATLRTYVARRHPGEFPHEGFQTAEWCQNHPETSNQLARQPPRLDAPFWSSECVDTLGLSYAP